MNKECLMSQLKEKIENKPMHLSEQERLNAHQQYLEYHKNINPDTILVIPMEEMAELTKVLSKILRNKMQPADIELLEEMADLQICLDNLMLHFGIDKETMEYVKDIKFERCMKRIKNNDA